MIDQKEDLTLQNPSKDVEEAQVSTTLQDEGMISKESKKEKNVAKIRLNVLIQKLGISSRRKADELIAAGMVKVNGKTVKTLGSYVPENAALTIDGKKYSTRPDYQTYLFHKPYRFLTTRMDKNNRSIIYDLPHVKMLPSNVQPVGRLDYKSEGLLILTNDGMLSYALAHPKFLIPKTYHVLLSSPIAREEVNKLRKGVLLEDGFAKPKSIRLKQRENLGRSVGQWLEVTITEGRNRLIRRMFEFLGFKVVRLIRLSIGIIRLPSKLEPGELRVVTEAERVFLEKVKGDLGKISEVSVPKNHQTKKPQKKVSLNDEQYAKKAIARENELKKLRKSKEQEVPKTPQRTSP
jgi:23S rRNA pseudouridine2605 synthase